MPGTGASLRSLPPLAVSVADGRSKTRTPAGLHCQREMSGALSLISVVFLEQVQKKLLDFFDSDMLQLFDFERVLIDQMVLFDRDVL
jgi:hypothetical protein